MQPRVHVIGAGLSGLAAAVALAGQGQAVTVYEATGHAGGRCRSYFDERLGRRIDNGNHLLLSGNRAALVYLRQIGAADRLAEPARAAFAFLDVATHERWTLMPAAGIVPHWLLRSRQRAPGSRAIDYLRGVSLAWAGPSATVADCLAGTGMAYRRFWQPLTLAVLNASAEDGAARLLWPVLKETFGRGERACRPLIAAEDLANTFVEPALNYLNWHGAKIRWRARATALSLSAERGVTAIALAGGESVALGAFDAVVLAVPPAAAAKLVPGLTTPEHSRAIVNAHFRVPARRGAPFILGLVGGVGQWLFVRDRIASVTVSAADRLAGEDSETIAARVWPEVALALGLDRQTLPAWRIVKERRATFAQTPDEVRRRPPCRTACANLFLAGDWTDTGLPATIEGSVRSGNTAAQLAREYVCAA